MKKLTQAVFLAAACWVPFAGLGCDSPDPTNAVVTNGYPAPPEGGDPAAQTVVFKVWWAVSLFADPIPAGAESDTNRVIPANDYAYALLAPNWDPSSETPPSGLIPVRTKATLSVERGDTLHITFSDETIDGNCATGQPLSQDDADFITQRIFPGDFANVTYDASKCVATPLPSDGGEDASSSPATD